MIGELARARLDALLAPQLRAHARACADAMVRGRPAPPPPAELTTAPTRRALGNLLDDDPADAPWWLAAALLGAVEADPAVRRAHAVGRDWPALHALATARVDAAARAWARPYLAVVLRAYGVADVPAAGPLPDDAPAWREARGMPPLTEVALREVWSALHEGAPAAGWQIVGGDAPCSIVAAPRREVVSRVELGATTIAAWSRGLHELGHAAVGLALGVVPRAVDEAAAMAAARWLETPRALGLPGDEVSAAAARVGHARAGAHAAALAALEAALYAGAAPTRAEPPPAPLFDDPGAQAAYACAAARPGTPAPTLAALIAWLA